MKLEAVDRMNPSLVCVASVTDVVGSRFLVHFDNWDDTYDYWYWDLLGKRRHGQGASPLGHSDTMWPHPVIQLLLQIGERVVICPVDLN